MRVLRGCIIIDKWTIRAWWLVAAAGAAMGVVGLAQSFSFFSSGSSSSRITSPTVVSTYVTHNGELALFVLWRGSPGWFQRGGGATVSSGGLNGRQEWEQLSFGGLTFRLDFDYTMSLATLLGQQISLKDTNVVFVDEVDSQAGPKIVRVERVDPTLPASGDPGLIVLRRQPELVEFLQCDLRVSDAVMQALTALVCGQVRSQ